MNSSEAGPHLPHIDPHNIIPIAVGAVGLGLSVVYLAANGAFGGELPAQPVQVGDSGSRPPAVGEATYTPIPQATFEQFDKKTAIPVVTAIKPANPASTPKVEASSPPTQTLLTTEMLEFMSPTQGKEANPKEVTVDEFNLTNPKYKDPKILTQEIKVLTTGEFLASNFIIDTAYMRNITQLAQSIGLDKAVLAGVPFMQADGKKSVINYIFLQGAQDERTLTIPSSSSYRTDKDGIGLPTLARLQKDEDGKIEYVELDPVTREWKLPNPPIGGSANPAVSPIPSETKAVEIIRTSTPVPTPPEPTATVVQKENVEVSPQKRAALENVLKALPSGYEVKMKNGQLTLEHPDYPNQVFNLDTHILPDKGSITIGFSSKAWRENLQKAGVPVNKDYYYGLSDSTANHFIARYMTINDGKLLDTILLLQPINEKTNLTAKPLVSSGGSTVVALGSNKVQIDGGKSAQAVTIQMQPFDSTMRRTYIIGGLSNLKKNAPPDLKFPTVVDALQVYGADIIPNALRWGAYSAGLTGKVKNYSLGGSNAFDDPNFIDDKSYIGYTSASGGLNANKEIIDNLAAYVDNPSGPFPTESVIADLEQINQFIAQGSRAVNIQFVP
ncbi:MAG: hypothetical protein Q7S72_02100 [Candidatus Taylorbacteria bacterium]|nr:hypothetical protein [Candidatus Taylorbacteria bacterium]